MRQAVAVGDALQAGPEFVAAGFQGRGFDPRLGDGNSGGQGQVQFAGGGLEGPIGADEGVVEIEGDHDEAETRSRSRPARDGASIPQTVRACACSPQSCR